MLVAYYLKAVQNFLHTIFDQYKLCLFSTWANAKMVGIGYLLGTCSPIFVVEDISGLFTHPSIFF